MKKIVLVLVLSIFGLCAHGQTDLLLTQQIFSRMNFNPAATGATNYTNIFLLNRIQWVGIDGAPNTQYLDVHKFLPDISSGFGGTLIRDQLGLEHYYEFKLSYSYLVRFTENSFVSFGLSGGVEYHTISGEKYYEDPTAPTIIYDTERKLSPDFNFGVEYTHDRLLLGASVTHVQRENLSGTLGSERHFYMYAQYQQPLDDWKLSPAVIMTNSINTFNFDALLLATYKEKLWFGGSFRFDQQFTGTSLSLLAGAWIMENFRLGYSYDININKQVAKNGGSHEIMLSYRFGKPANPARYPRFIEL